MRTRYMFRSSSPPGVPPTPEEALACGSRSTRSVFFSITEREAARLTAVVVFPTPPFWLATVRIRANAGPPLHGNTTVSCTTGGRCAKGEIPALVSCPLPCGLLPGEIYGG